MIQTPVIETDRDKLQAAIARASEQLYKVAKSAYGPGSGNVVLGFKHGAPMLSRDGVTNMSQVRLEDPFEDDIVQAILQVSQKNNDKVGDGTTAVVILTHHLLMAAQKLEGKGFKPMEIATKLKEAEQIALKYVDSLVIPADDKLLEFVGTVAAGDPEIGKLIYEIMHEIGKDGGTMIEPMNGLGIQSETIDGFYFHKGFKNAKLINDPTSFNSSHKEVPVLVSSKRFDTEVDIAPVIQVIQESGFKEVIMVADVNNTAMLVLEAAKAKGIIMAVPVDPDYAAGGQALFLSDAALMLGCEVYDGGEFEINKHLGLAQEVLITASSTSIFGGDGDKEAIQNRLDQVREQLKETDHPQQVQFMKERLARLTAKMAIIKVGGAIEFERDEKKERVRDAVCAVQSAMKEGVLPGGGVVLARITGTEFDDAFKEPFKQLVTNAGGNPEAFLGRLEGSDDWDGFNLRNVSEKPINLLKEGVLDAALVVREIIINSISVVSGLITASAAVAQREKE